MSDVALFRLDRPTALYNAGLWLVFGGVGAAVAFVIGSWWLAAGIGIGVLAGLAVVIAVVMALRPPWVVRIDDRLTVRGRGGASIALADVRDVRWVAGELVVRSESDQVRVPHVAGGTSLADLLRDRLERQ